MSGEKKYRYGYAEIAAALSSNDDRVDPEMHDLPVDNAGDLLDPVSAVLDFHGVDPEGVTEASMQRAMNIAQSGEISALTIMVGGFPLLASWGAAWMDGFAAALALIGPLDEDDA
jgi:hypothetical protein